MNMIFGCDFENTYNPGTILENKGLYFLSQNQEQVVNVVEHNEYFIVSPEEKKIGIETV